METNEQAFVDWWEKEGRAPEFIDVVRQTAQLAWYAGASWALRKVREEQKDDD